METSSTKTTGKKLSWLLLVFILSLTTKSFGQLNGTYTIGGTVPDYETISEAIADLEILGVSGPVIFNIRNGNYREGFALSSNITGSSEINTITIQSESSINTDVTIQSVSITNVSNFTVQNISISGIGGVNVNSTGSNLAFVGNIIREGIHFNQVVGGKILIKNNEITAATIGMDIKGLSTEEVITDLVIRNNTISYSSALGARIQYVNGVVYKNNAVSSNSANSSYQSLNLSYSKGIFEVSNNIISSPGAGFNFDNVNAVDALISNNFITSEGNGFALSRCSNFLIAHNSLNAHGLGLVYGSNNQNIQILNNNIVAENIAFSISSNSLDNLTSNYNNIFSSGFALVKYYDVSTYTYKSLIFEEWKEISLMDQNSLSQNPLYFSENDLHAKNFFLSNAGLQMAKVSEDIDGEERDGTPSIGADEFTAIAPIPLSGNYFIDPQDPTADFTSLNEAVFALIYNGMGAPVKLVLADGVFDEQIYIPEINGSSAENILTIESESGVSSNTIIEYSSDLQDKNFVVQLNNTSYVTIKNLTFRATNPSYGRTLYLTNRQESVLIENCTIESPLVSGPYYDSNAVEVHSSRYNNISFTNNSIIGGYRGFQFYGSKDYSNVLVQQNTISDSYYKGINFQNSGKFTIEKNNIFSNQYENFISLHVQSCDGEISIVANTLKGNRNGLVVENCIGSGNSLIANNFISAYSDQPAFQYSASLRHYLYFNSVRNGGTGVAAKINPDPYLSYGNVFVENNIFQAETGEALIFQNGRSISTPSFDYNNYFSNGSNLVNTYQTLDQWRGAEYGNENSFSVDPLFNSLTDLHSNSPELDDAGYFYDLVPNDFDGEARDDTPSIGADEFTVIPDQDGDKIPDEEDNCVLVKNFDQKDTDGDGKGDACDTDDDGDGVVDSEDCEPLNPDVGLITWYMDNDRDGFGDANAVGVTQCTPPSLLEPYVTNNTDCDDRDPLINPFAQEIPNDSIDQDCDGEDLVILGTDGCSADFWKNRVTWCDRFDQQDDFYSTFGILNDKGLGNLTLLSSLDGKKGEWGKLAQQATAAILNWCDTGVLYSISGTEIFVRVETIFNDPNSGRNEAKALREELEIANNAVCPLNQVAVDRQGCSVDYWINSTTWCLGINQVSNFIGTFNISSSAASARLGTDYITLLEALQLKGGGYNKLAKEATAALLNACNENIDFPLTRDQILTGTKELFEDSRYGNKDANDLSSLYADANNSFCPLSTSVQSTSVITTSTKDVSDSGIQMPTAYPNPMDADGFWLSFPAETGGQTFEASMYDFNGRLLIQKYFEVPLNGSDIFWNVNHSGWDQGVYRLILRSGSNESVINLMKD